MNALRQALSHMNESSAESAKNPTNGEQEEPAGDRGGRAIATHHHSHEGGGGKGMHSVHHIHEDGTAKSSTHAHGEGGGTCPLCGGTGKE